MQVIAQGTGLITTPEGSRMLAISGRTDSFTGRPTLKTRKAATNNDTQWDLSEIKQYFCFRHAVNNNWFCGTEGQCLRRNSLRRRENDWRLALEGMQLIGFYRGHMTLYITVMADWRGINGETGTFPARTAAAPKSTRAPSRDNLKLYKCPGLGAVKKVLRVA